MAEVDKTQTALVRPVNVTEKLRQLRARAKLSQAQIAKKMGLKGQSSYQRYEDATEFQKVYLPGEFVEKLIPILQGKGQPPIALDEILSLAGLSTIEDGFVSKKLAQSIVAEKSPIWIPVLRWEQVSMWMQGQLKQADIEKYTDASHDNPGEFSFTIIIRDNSMTPSNINIGDKVVCDPSKSYNPGDIVIASVTDMPEPVIGQYRRKRSEAGQLFTEIAPTNVSFPSHVIDDKRPGKVIGKAVECRKAL